MKNTRAFEIPVCTLTSQHQSSADSDSVSILTVSLLNIRSVRKHGEDIKFNSQLFNSDVLAPTETQLLPNDSDMESKENLEPFRIYRQDHCTDKYSSMAICVKYNLKVENYEYIPTLNALEFDLVDTTKITIFSFDV